MCEFNSKVEANAKSYSPSSLSPTSSPPPPPPPPQQQPNFNFYQNDQLDPTTCPSQKYPQYVSAFELELLKSSEPIEVTVTDEAVVFGQRGILANKNEVNEWRGELPIDKYPLNKDLKPKVITKKSSRIIEYTQEIAVRYLRPPTPPLPGDIIIRLIFFE
jgi:hypothetical protein